MRKIDKEKSARCGTGDIPAVIEGDGADPTEWLETRRAQLEAALSDCGAVLLRGFAFSSVDAFDRFLTATGGSRLAYTYRSTVRRLKGDRIYTATEYPAAADIMLHSENAYQSDWPMKLFFFCLTPAGSGGETPIASNIRVAAALPPDMLARFACLGLLYVRNYPNARSAESDSLDLSWQTVFQTEEVGEVEEFCRSQGMSFEWKENSGLRTKQKRGALSPHPTTGKLLWFNQAHVMHVSNMKPEQEAALREVYEETDLPRNCYYGDGSPIERSVLDLVREAYVQQSHVFSWRSGDVMILDNMLVAHGRLPYIGKREVLLAMTDPYSAATKSKI
jgi:alpha-ketoglutarate-dependent taurine dioxygenase